jgi:hypothetical protein
MKKRNIILLSVLGICLTTALTLYIVFGSTLFSHKLKHGLVNTPPVVAEAVIDSILNSFEKVPLSALPKSLLVSGDFSKPEFQGHFHGRTFYKVKLPQAMQKIVGDWRIIDFISEDQKSTWFYSMDAEFYWLIDKKVLHAFLQLKNKMEAKNLDWKAIKLRCGHRSPNHNKVVGGASMSRHICGEAIDFNVGDADKNGIVNYEDKKKVLALCELVIGNKGGIGLYPNTQAVHIDTRGYKARWDSY